MTGKNVRLPDPAGRLRIRSRRLANPRVTSWLLDLGAPLPEDERMSDPAPSAARPNARSAKNLRLLVAGLSTAGLLLALGLVYCGSKRSDSAPVARPIAAPAPMPQLIDSDDDPFADLPGTPQSAPFLPTPDEADSAALSQKYMFVTSQAEDALKPIEMGKVASAEVIAARHKHVADSAAELEKLALARRDALAALAAALDAQPDATPSRWIDLLDAEHAAHQARLAVVVELSRRIELDEAYVDRLAKLEAELNGKTPATGNRNLLALRAAQAEAALELAREHYRDQLGPAEITILEDTAARLQELFDQITALYLIGEKGGESERRARVGYECSRARAHLARACGDRPAALAELRHAFEFAREEEQSPQSWEEPLDLNEHLLRRRHESDALLELIEYARLLGDQEQIDWAERGGR
jgi:hypothetical protein